MPADAINWLWRVSRADAAAEQVRLLADVPPASEDALHGTVIAAVSRHLRARALLAMRELKAAGAEARAALTAWDGAIAVVDAINPQMAVRAHAFHARLASRHQDAYRDFARKQLLDLARCARLKSDTIPAEIAAARGDRRSAAEALDGVSMTWRADLPIRLPGLGAVELAAAEHFAAIGDDVRTQRARQRAATIAGAMRAYPEDAPDHWPLQPTQEGLLRFAFAAARLPASLERGSSPETIKA